MKQLVEFKLQNDDSVVIEVEEIGDTSERVSRKDLKVTHAESRFHDAIAKIRPAAEEVLTALHEMNTPNEISIEFGIKFSGKVGAFIASADSEATFKISLKWMNKKDEQNQ